MTWHSTDITAAGTSEIDSVEISNLPLLVIQREDGIWAIEDRCSHADCAFSTDGEIDGYTAICDCHGSEFDIRTGEVLFSPADEPIRVLKTRIVDDRVEVEL